jgi:hypothetical protein
LRRIHLNHGVPFTDFKSLDGLTYSQILQQNSIFCIANQPALSAVQDYLNILLSIALSIHSRSVLYSPLEILTHCQFKGFSWPLHLCDADFRANVLSDLSLCEISGCADLFDTLAKQARYVCGRENCTMFLKHVNKLSLLSNTLAESLQEAVVEEMAQYPEEYKNNFPTENRFNDFLSSKEIDFNSLAVTNSVCAGVASSLKSVVIYLFPESLEKIHVAIPVFHEKDPRLINNYPLFIKITQCEGKLSYSCTETIAHNKHDDSLLNDDSEIVSTGKCTCGKGRKNTTASCTGSRCPCVKLGEPCTGRCGCQLCENSKGTRFENIYMTGLSMTCTVL